MGLGWGKKRRRQRGGRRSRRIRDVDDPSVRQYDQSSSSLICCCISQDPIEKNQEKIDALQDTQRQMLEKIKSRRTEISLEDQENPVWHASHNQKETDMVEEFQEAQLELLEDILRQQREATDPQKAQALSKQAEMLRNQMLEVQSAGFGYPGGIPNVQITQKQEEMLSS